MLLSTRVTLLVPAFSTGLGVVCRGNLNARLALIVRMHPATPASEYAEAPGALLQHVDHARLAAIWDSLGGLFSDDAELQVGSKL